MTERVTVDTDGGSRSGSSSTSTGWSAQVGEPTTLVLLRHGVTRLTERKAFSGSGGEDPALTDAGRQQADRAASWLERHVQVDAVVSSPLLRTRQTAGVVADRLGQRVEIEPGLVETSFGDWDGHTFGEIQARWPDEMTAWLGSTAVPPPHGESFDEVDRRVMSCRERLVASHPGCTVVAVSHVSPIKLLVRQVLGAPMTALYTMELSPASITTIAWWPDGNASLRAFNLVPE